MGMCAIDAAKYTWFETKIDFMYSHVVTFYFINNDARWCGTCKGVKRIQLTFCLVAHQLWEYWTNNQI